MFDSLLVVLARASNLVSDGKLVRRDQPTTHLLFGSSEIRETSRYVPTKATVGLTRRKTS